MNLLESKEILLVSSSALKYNVILCIPGIAKLKYTSKVTVESKESISILITMCEQKVHANKIKKTNA